MDVARAGFRLLRENPRQSLLPFAAIMAPVTAVTIVISVVAYLTVFSDEDYPVGGLLTIAGTGGPLFASLCLLAVAVLFGAVAQGAAVVGDAAASQRKDLALSAALDPAFTRLGGLLALVLIVVGVVGGLAITVVGIPVAIFLALRWAFAIPAFMIEDMSPGAALGRSWNLSRGHFWRLLGLAGVFLLVFLPLGLLNSLPIAWESAERDTRVILDGLAALLAGLASIPAAAFLTAATTTYYLRLKEGHA